MPEPVQATLVAPGPSNAPATSSSSSSRPAVPGTTENKKPAAAQPKKKAEKEAGGSGKSAKEEKKAKRAAAVAARGGAPPGPPGGPPGASGSSGAGPSNAGGKDAKGKEAARAGDKTTQDGGATVLVAAGALGTTIAHSTTSIAAVSTLLFSHLPSSRPPKLSSTSTTKHFHPLVYRLGLLLSTPSPWTTSSPAFQPRSPPLRGTNARTTALLLTFRQVIIDHSWPPREMHRVLPAHLSPMIGFLDGCRPKGVAGGNVIRWLKAEINRVGTDESIREESEVSFPTVECAVHAKLTAHCLADNCSKNV